MKKLVQKMLSFYLFCCFIFLALSNEPQIYAGNSTKFEWIRNCSLDLPEKIKINEEDNSVSRTKLQIGAKKRQKKLTFFRSD